MKSSFYFLTTSDGKIMNFKAEMTDCIRLNAGFCNKNYAE